MKSLQIVPRNRDNLSYKETKDTTQSTETSLQKETNRLAT